MSSHETGLFGSEYWNFHRNSLFFSALTLIISAPGVDFTGLEISGLKFGDLGSTIILLCSALAASYCFFAFLFEWLQEARPYLRHRGNAFHSTLAARKSVLETLDKLAKYQTHTLNLIQYNLEDRECVVIQETMNSLSNIASKFVQDNPDIRKITDNNGQDVARHFHTFAGCVGQTLEFKSNRLRNSMTAYPALVEKMNEDVSEYRATVSRMAFPLRCNDFEVKLRVSGFGLGAPLILYITAIAHTCGAVGYVLAPSLLFHGHRATCQPSKAVANRHSQRTTPPSGM